MDSNLDDYIKDLLEFDIDMANIFNSAPFEKIESGDSYYGPNISNQGYPKNRLHRAPQTSPENPVDTNTVTYVSGEDNNYEQGEKKIINDESMLNKYSEGKKSKSEDDIHYSFEEHYITNNNNLNVIRKLYAWLRKTIPESVVTIPEGTILYRSITRDNPDQLNSISGNFEDYDIGGRKLKQQKTGMYFNLSPYCNMSVNVPGDPIDSVMLFKTTKNIYLLNTVLITRLLQFQLKSGEISFTRGYSKRFNESTISTVLTEMGLNGQLSIDIVEIVQLTNINGDKRILLPTSDPRQAHKINSNLFNKEVEALHQHNDRNILYISDMDKGGYLPLPVELYIISNKWSECYVPYINPSYNNYLRRPNSVEFFNGQSTWLLSERSQEEKDNFITFAEKFCEDWNTKLEGTTYAQEKYDYLSVYDLDLYNDINFREETCLNINKDQILVSTKDEKTMLDTFVKSILASTLKENFNNRLSRKIIYPPLEQDHIYSRKLLNKLRNTFCDELACINTEHQYVKNDSVIDEKEFKSGDDLKEWFTENFYKNKYLNQKVKEFTATVINDINEYDNYNPMIYIIDYFKGLYGGTFGDGSQLGLVKESTKDPRQPQNLNPESIKKFKVHISHTHTGEPHDKRPKDSTGKPMNVKCNISNAILQIILRNIRNNDNLGNDNLGNDNLGNNTESIKTLINKLLYINHTTSGNYNQLSYQSLLVGKNKVTDECREIDDSAKFPGTSIEFTDINGNIQKKYPPTMVNKLNEGISDDNPMIHCSRILKDIDKLMEHLHIIDYLTKPTLGVKILDGPNLIPDTNNRTPIAYWNNSPDAGKLDISEVNITDMDHLIFILSWELGIIHRKDNNIIFNTSPSNVNIRETNIKTYNTTEPNERVKIIGKRVDLLKDEDELKKLINDIKTPITLDDAYKIISKFIIKLNYHIKQISSYFVRLYLKGGTAFKMLFQDKTLFKEGDDKITLYKKMKIYKALINEDIPYDIVGDRYNADLQSVENNLNTFLVKELGENSDYDLLMTFNPWLLENEYNLLYKASELDCYYVIKTYLENNIATRGGIANKLGVMTEPGIDNSLINTWDDVKVGEQLRQLPGDTTNIKEILESKSKKYELNEGDTTYEFKAELNTGVFSEMCEIDSRDPLNKIKLPRKEPIQTVENSMFIKPTGFLEHNAYLSQNELMFKDTEAGVWKMTTEFGLMRFMLKYPLKRIIRNIKDSDEETELKLNMKDNDDLLGIVEIIDISLVKYSGRERVQKWNDSEELESITINNNTGIFDPLKIDCYPLDITVKDIQETIEDNILSGRTRKLQKRKKREELLLYMVTLIKLSDNKHVEISDCLNKYLLLKDVNDNILLKEEAENYIKSFLGFNNVKDTIVIEMDNKTKAAFIKNVYLKINTGHLSSPGLLPWNIKERCKHYITYLIIILSDHTIREGSGDNFKSEEDKKTYYELFYSNNVTGIMKGAQDEIQGTQNWIGNITREDCSIHQRGLLNQIEEIEKYKRYYNEIAHENTLINILFYVIRFMNKRINPVYFKEFYSIVFTLSSAYLTEIVSNTILDNNKLKVLFNDELDNFFASFQMHYYTSYEYPIKNPGDLSSCDDHFYSKILLQRCVMAQIFSNVTKCEPVLYSISTDNYLYSNTESYSKRSNYIKHPIDYPYIGIKFKGCEYKFEHQKYIQKIFGKSPEDRLNKLRGIINEESVFFSSWFEYVKALHRIEDKQVFSIARLCNSKHEIYTFNIDINCKTFFNQKNDNGDYISSFYDFSEKEYLSGKQYPQGYDNLKLDEKSTESKIIKYTLFELNLSYLPEFYISQKQDSSIMIMDPTDWDKHPILKDLDKSFLNKANETWSKFNIYISNYNINTTNNYNHISRLLYSYKNVPNLVNISKMVASTGNIGNITTELQYTKELLTNLQSQYTAMMEESRRVFNSLQQQNLNEKQQNEQLMVAGQQLEQQFQQQQFQQQQFQQQLFQQQQFQQQQFQQWGQLSKNKKHKKKQTNKKHKKKQTNNKQTNNKQTNNKHKKKQTNNKHKKKQTNNKHKKKQTDKKHKKKQTDKKHKKKQTNKKHKKKQTDNKSKKK